MSIVEKIRGLCDTQGITLTELERMLGIGRGIIGRWKNSSPNVENIQKVADHFHVSVDYLLGRESKDEKDIARSMDKIKRQLYSEEGLMFDGEILDTDTAKLLLDAIEQQERMLKVLNKKFIPNKYR